MARFAYACPMRWSDSDAYGHINNVQFMRYLEEARVELFFRVARQAGLPDFEGALVVVRHEIDYRRPLFHRSEPIDIEVWVTEIRASAFTIAYVVQDESTTYAEARTTLAMYDPATERARRLSEAERAWLKNYLDG